MPNLIGVDGKGCIAHDSLALGSKVMSLHCDLLGKAMISWLKVSFVVWSVRDGIWMMADILVPVLLDAGSECRSDGDHRPDT